MSEVSSAPRAKRDAAKMRPEQQPAADVAAALRAPRICIERVSPLVDGGRYPAKSTVGQEIDVEADVFTDGHDHLAVRLLWWTPGAAQAQATPMQFLGNDRWRASVPLTVAGRHRFSVEAWLDAWGSFRHDLGKKVGAGVAVALEIAEGRLFLRRGLERATDDAKPALTAVMRELDGTDDRRAVQVLLGEQAATAMAAVDERKFLTRVAPEPIVEVERRAAGFASWYELFPRSAAPGARAGDIESSSGRRPETRDPKRHGTFDDVISRLPAIRAMGFDVLYFPPIHPIGKKNRKGRNNSLTAQPDDPGSPYAIGSPDGGHDAVHPELGGIDAFRRLRAAAEHEGIELALDFAVQFSPDHPWLQQHPGWFSWRPDGSLRYAENPPKKYEDIVPPDFYSREAAPALWLALRDVIESWIGEGVKTFRVDNPHTKPLPFWEWLIADIRLRHPEAIFLSEAFTRPAMMNRLAKIGFTQSYTYFTWRNTKRELTEYVTQLTTEPPKDFFRPHFFVNTPDINPYFLQTSGRPGFLIRSALATTLSGLWGMYSGFEICEAAPLPGKEEYLDAEKYEIRVRDWHAPGNIVAEITRLNHLRRENPALQTHLNTRFYNFFNDQVLYYGKATPDRKNFILVAVSLDPHHPQEGQFEVPLWELGLPDHAAVEVVELMRGGRFTWHGKLQHWRFAPEMPFAIWRIAPGGAGR
jgi:starch synthase (maltosyl-transferring)